MKKYNEVLERAKEAYKHCATDAEKKRLEFIFPELVESENKRMERLIKTALYNQSDELVEYYRVHNITEEEIFAWLEKQGKQKMPAMIQWKGDNLKDVIDFTGVYKEGFEKWFHNSWEEFEKYVHEHNNIFKIFNEDGSHIEVPVGAWIVKTPDGYNIASRYVFRQKTTEWSEDDKDTLDWICRIINRAKQLELITQEEETFLEKWLDKWLNHSLELKEQDKKMLDSLITIFDTQYLNSVYSTKNGLISGIEIVDWLKSLKQEEHKSVWSEDDEAILKAIIQDIQERHHDAMWNIDTSKTAAVSTEFIIKFLKSLKPQNKWKPSEEQMQTLHVYINEGALTYPEDKRVLTTLYEDLLKL